MSTSKPYRNRSLLVLFAGIAHALSFAPDPLPLSLLPYVQLISLAILLGTALGSTRMRTALGYAFAFGTGSFGVGVYWVYISMHDFGGLPSLAAGAATLAMAAILALFYVLNIALIRRLLPPARMLTWSQQIFAAALVASVWTATEWLRGTLFSGFPWLNIAYAHVDSLFSGWAPIAGAYALSWCAAFAATTLALYAITTRQQERTAAVIPMATAIVLAVLGAALGQIPWSQPLGDRFIVRLVQGNIPQDQKFSPEFIDDAILSYQRLAALAAKDPNSKPQLIVLPETIVPYLQTSLPPAFWQEWIDISAEQDAPILLGAPLRHHQPDDSLQYTNSVMFIDANTNVNDIYDLHVPHYSKSHLVPFGEYVPTGFQWLVDAMDIPLSSFHRGEIRQPNFPLSEQLQLAPNICYEDTFGEEIIRAVRDDQDNGAGANLLINVSNLAWFDPSWASLQHLQMSRLRAMETARPMLRATNTGVTAAITERGVIQAMLPVRTKAVLDVEVQATTGLTPYVRVGNKAIFWWILLAGFSSAYHLLKVRARARATEAT